MRAWQRRHRKQVRAYTAAWNAANPEKVKAHKKKAAKKYAIRRRMLYKARTPERIAEDNRKALERYHRRYRNRSPEQVKKDSERNREKYQVHRKELKALREAIDPRITLAVCLEIQDVKRYDMKDRLFPDVKRLKMSAQREARHDRVKKLFKRRSEELERERNRIVILSPRKRVIVAEDAELRIRKLASLST